MSKHEIDITLDVRYSEDPRIEPGLDELNGEVIGDSSPAKIRAAIASKKEIADAIRSKHGRIADDTPLAGYAEEISAIEQGVVTRDDTVTAETMLEGVTAHNAAGEQITGNIKTVTASLKDNTVTVPAGYVADGQTLTVAEMAASLSGNTVTIPKGYNPAEKTLIVAEAEAPIVSENIVTVNPGYVASKQTVTVAEAGALSVSDNVVTVPVGYIKSQRTATVAVAADPAVSDNKVTVNKGYVPEQKIITIAEAAEPTIASNVVTVYKGYVKSQKTVTIPEMTVQNDGEKVIIPVGYNKKTQEITISGGGIDTSDATATAAQMLNGVTAYVKGVKITGNIPTVTATLSGNVATVPAGYIASKQTLTVPTVTATMNANTVTVPVGYIAEKQTLTIPAVTPTLADNVVTVPQGYIAEQKTLTVAEMAEPSLSANVVTIGKGYNKAQKTVTVPEAGELSVTDNVVTVPVGYIKTARTATVPVAAAPSTSGNVVTVNKGYQAEQKKITVGTSVAAKTYTPGTTDQTIAAGSYLAGKQTIKGDANLVAANIADGKTIFGISGTHKGGDSSDGGTMNFYRCISYDNGGAISAHSNVVISGLTSPVEANGIYILQDMTAEGAARKWMNINGYAIESMGSTWYIYNTMTQPGVMESLFYADVLPSTTGDGSAENPVYWDEALASSDDRTLSESYLTTDYSSSDNKRNFYVKLKAGTPYKFGVSDGGIDADILLYDLSGTQLAQGDENNDNINGTDYWDSISYTPSVTGIYRLSAGAYSYESGTVQVVCYPAPEYAEAPTATEPWEIEWKLGGAKKGAYIITAAGYAGAIGEYTPSKETFDADTVWTNTTTGTVWRVRSTSGNSVQWGLYKDSSDTAGLYYNSRYQAASTPWELDPTYFSYVSSKYLPFPTLARGTGQAEGTLAITHQDIADRPATGVKAWSGYRAVQNEETAAWSISTEVVTDLPVRGSTPKAGEIYSADTTVRIKKLYNGANYIIPADGLVFFAPLATDYANLVNEEQAVVQGGQFTTYNGLRCVYLDGSAYIKWANDSNLPTGAESCSLFILVSPQAQSEWRTYISMGQEKRDHVNISLGNGVFLEWGGTPLSVDGKWHSLCLVRNNQGEASAYIDGTFNASGTRDGILPTPSCMCVGANMESSYIQKVKSYVAYVAAYDRELSASEIVEIHNTLMKDVQQ